MNETWLAHHGILGQKWGIRRFQNKDGSLTAAGKRRLGKQMEKDANKMRDEMKDELRAKTSAAYQKATDYADKHQLDYDDILDEDVSTEKGRKIALSRLTSNGVNKSTAEYIIEYNRLTKAAEVEETKIWKEGKNKINKELMSKYGGFGLDDIKKLKRAGTIFDPDRYKIEDLEAEKKRKEDRFRNTKPSRPSGAIS